MFLCPERVLRRPDLICCHSGTIMSSSLGHADSHERTTPESFFAFAGWHVLMQTVAAPLAAQSAQRVAALRDVGAGAVTSLPGPTGLCSTRPSASLLVASLLHPTIKPSMFILANSTQTGTVPSLQLRLPTAAASAPRTPPAVC